VGYLRVNKVIYSGQKYRFESEEFDKNIVLIEGDNGTGKSTLCNLIYFALGGEVPSFRKTADKRHDEITSDIDNYVDLFTTISGTNYVLRRYVGDNDITVIPYEKATTKPVKEGEAEEIVINLLSEKTENHPVNRHKGRYIFSDWMLEELGISVVELYHGYSSFKINFSDLMRLIYHDQQPDPENIYKKLDTKSTVVADSEVARNAVFELLIGKSYSDYYDAIVVEKKLARDKLVARGLVDEYTLLADKMRRGGDIKNISFLQTAIEEKALQIEKLHDARLAFKSNRSSANTVGPDMAACKSEIISHELCLSEKKGEMVSLLNERYKLLSLRSGAISEIRQLQKVIFSHDQLNLFTADTCPYCLGEVSRQDNHCVCGSTIEEEQYERFFYTSQEYKEILKSKIKSLETVDAAFEDCNQDVLKVKDFVNNIEKLIRIAKASLAVILGKLDQVVDVESLNNIDDKILQLREDVSDLNQSLEIESKLNDFQKALDGISGKAKNAELKRKELEAQAKQDVSSKVTSFSEKYNDLMVSTLPDCRTAKIQLGNYLPSINDGLYRETSSLVSIRLMYFITMMHLALSDDSVTFPKFLLVDTPDTAGIEPEHLINCIRKLEELEAYDSDYQVIITTGLNKYPESLKDNRVLYMPDKNVEEYMLLRKVES